MLPFLTQTSKQDQQTIQELLERLRRSTSGGGEAADTVSKIIQDVENKGDEAVVQYMQKWTNPRFKKEQIRVRPEEMAQARSRLPADLLDSLNRSIDHVRSYQTHIRPKDPPEIEIDGARLGLRFSPIRRAGLHVPGGKAAYPSSVVMLAVPAQVAGVQALSVVSPPPTGSDPSADVSPLVLGVCDLLGIERVYRIGGAQAIAALALGTESVEPVDFIAGPGNAYTQQAKRQLFGRIGIDGFFGPSEVVVLADDSANPQWIAADLLAQAEHDPGCCFLIGWQKPVLEAICSALVEQLEKRQRRSALEKALKEWSAAILTADRDQALELVNTLAAEHVTLAVADPQETLKKIRNGGAFFLGDQTPVASGDYYAGPSHCLPTGTTAGYNSGLSVYTFLKRSSVESYPHGLSDQAISDIARLAEAEGLEAHAASVRARGQKN